MSAPGPISDAEMASIIRRVLKAGFGADLSDGLEGPAFDFLTLATGQRFRVTVAEIPDDAPDDAASLLEQS